MIPSYIVVYYAVAALAVAGMPLFVDWRRKDAVPLRSFIVLTVAVTYVLGMTRQSGVDYGNYVRAYLETPHEIVDPGFRLLMWVFRSLSLPFTALQLLTAFITLAALRRAARFFNVSVGLLLVIYFLHLAVVRDFAQFRSGFAIAIVVFGITAQGKWWRLGYYILAASMHLTSAVLALSYEFCAMVARDENRVRQSLMIAGGALVWAVVGLSLPHLGFVDPRVQIYVQWEVENYGLPVRQFQIMYLQLAILALAFVTRRWWRNDSTMRTLVFLQVIGIAIFFSFRDVAMFAYRLSSAALSLYPVLLVALLQRLRLSVHRYSIARISAAAMLLLIGLMLISRQGNVEILQSIGF